MGSIYYSKRIPTRTAKRRKRDRAKTFKTEESAKEWAEKKGLKDYKLVNLKSPDNKTKKIKVIA